MLREGRVQDLNSFPRPYRTHPRQSGPQKMLKPLKAWDPGGHSCLLPFQTLFLRLSVWSVSCGQTPASSLWPGAEEGLSPNRLLTLTSPSLRSLPGVSLPCVNTVFCVYLKLPALSCGLSSKAGALSHALIRRCLSRQCGGLGGPWLVTWEVTMF